jgi:hypothetical protein
MTFKRIELGSQSLSIPLIESKTDANRFRSDQEVLKKATVHEIRLKVPRDDR